MITVKAINISMELWGCLIAVLIAVFIMLESKPKSPRSRAYMSIALCLALLLLSDAMGFLFEGKPSHFHWCMVSIANFMVFCLGYVLLLFFTKYLRCYLAESGQVSNLPVIINTVLTTVAIVLVVISQFNHMYYSINADSIYVRGDLFWISQFFGIAGMLVNIVFLLVYFKRVDTYLKVVLGLYILLPIIAMIVQIFEYGLALLNFANTISLVVMFLFVHLDYAHRERILHEKLSKQSYDLAISESKLAQSRMDLMKSQIQPHFIYNTLGTIGELCLVQPEKAAEITREFSQYLRGNFDELECSSPIRLSREIEHVKHYTAIEHVRFPDMQVYFDLRSEDFFLPALSIQPLVENAIKHGLMGLETGGVVIISAFETDEAYCICVKDDGVGFDVNAPMSKNGRRHLGIANIRERLEIMCGGSLLIESVPGRGTSATILIPKEGSE